MILACGLSNYNLALFHLITHAFFKALLFLTAGSIIHSLVDEQDIRKMGGLQRILPISYAALLIGSLALTGFPFLAGYYSKDYIMESVFVSNPNFSYILYVMVILVAFFTSIYSLRILYLVFFTKTNISRGVFVYISESSWIICSVLVILSIFSIFAGYFLFDIYAGFGSLFLSNSVLVLPQHYYQQYSEFLPIIIKLIPLFLGFFAIFLFFFIYYFFFSRLYDLKFKFLFVYRFLIKKWFFDIFFNKWFVLPLYYFGYNVTYRLIDKGILELIGPFGLSVMLTKCCRFIQKSFFFFSLSFNFLLIILWFIYCLYFFFFFN
jgi:NADH-ubiquinone oxidoreductase chain 5